MSWNGWFEFGGTEIVNVARTEAYAAAAGLGWFKPVYAADADALPILMQETYTTPLQDDAPWTDPRDSDSYDFYGVYPLSIEGIEDSTWRSSVTENTTDGGVVGRTRRATRSVTFSVVLIGKTECAVEMGMRWLRTALGGRPCLGISGQNCGGHDLCYLRCAPLIDPDEALTGRNIFIPNSTTDWDGSRPWLPAEDWGSEGVLSGTYVFVPFDPQECLDEYTRTLRNVTFTVGPAVNRKTWMNDGGAAWLVTFTATAGNPFEWGQEETLIAGFMDPAVEMPYVVPAVGMVPTGAQWDAVGVAMADSDLETCALPVYAPVFDPECPLVIPPAGLPQVDLACFDFPDDYTRRQFTIPSHCVPIWGEVTPLLTIRTGDDPVRNMRVRFYADVLGNADIASQDHCAYCGNMIFTYIPANSTLVFDASDRVIYLEDPATGQHRRAEALVFGENGVPFEWPELTCGIGYIVTFDLPIGTVPPAVDMSMYARVA